EEKRIFAIDVQKQNDGLVGYLLGWVHEIRDLGSLVFIVLRDRTGTCQVSLRRDSLNQNELAELDKITKESVVRVDGIVRMEPKSRLGAELKASNLVVLSRAADSLPYDVVGKVKATMNTRLENRILDLRRPEHRAIFLIGDTVLSACREYLRSLGFVEVRTPRIIATATEGGASLFEVKYFDKTAYLAQSPQLYKEELVTVFERVFEIGPFFRAEESHTRRHISEFTSVDIEAAFLNYEGVMKILEELIVYVIEKVISERNRELKLLGVSLKVPKIPFLRISYDEALRELEDLGLKKKWGDDFTTQELRLLGSKHLGFYFITHFPTATKPFYIKPSDRDESVSESFDLMYQWLELSSGGTRISDRKLLESRIREQGLNPDAFRYHLKVYDYGMPLHAGWGLGFERLLMVLTRKTNIRETILFPRDKFRLTP
ncbi:MAG: aspartate--tRNA(Asn) ligase, partial [Nitrososphaerota archaeon]